MVNLTGQTDEVYEPVCDQPGHQNLSRRLSTYQRIDHTIVSIGTSCVYAVSVREAGDQGVVNGSQVGPGVELDHVEYCNAGGGNIERYGKDIVDPCYLVVVYSTTADRSGCQARSIAGGRRSTDFPYKLAVKCRSRKLDVQRWHLSYIR